MHNGLSTQASKPNSMLTNRSGDVSPSATEGALDDRELYTLGSLQGGQAGSLHEVFLSELAIV